MLFQVLTGQVIDVFNWRGPRPGEGDPPELQCTGGSHWLAAWGAAPAVLVGFPLQCGTALGLTCGELLGMSEGYQWSCCGLLGPS